MTNNWSEAIDLDGDRVIDAFAHSWVYESPNTTGGQFVGTVYSINTSGPLGLMSVNRKDVI